MPAVTLGSPVGRLTVVEAHGRIARVGWGLPASGTPTPLLRAAVAQLHAYFMNDISDFDLPLVDASSMPEAAVRTAMLAIPRGATMTYGEIATRTGSSARAVGQMCASNPLPIIVPCHRVVGVAVAGHYSGGGGADTKHWLLAHEGATLI